MSAERGLAKIMADEDCREWMNAMMEKGGLWNSEYYTTESLNEGRIAIWSFVSKQILSPIREHHHNEFLEMQREARRRLESQRIEQEKQREADEKSGRKPRTP